MHRNRKLVCFFLCFSLLWLLPACKPNYPNSRLLWSADSLEQKLSSDGLIIIDARAEGYDTAHIPGAIALHWKACATPALMLKSVSELELQLGAAGITRDSTIVIYDDTTASWGSAGRMFWMFEYLGCTDVHVLNGGWDKWVADARQTDATPVTLNPATFTAEANESITATTSHISERLGEADFAVIDTRTDEEYNGWQLYGEARGGHIPGAVQIPYAWNFNADKTILAYADLKALLEDRGITRRKEVTAYCTVGIRSGFQYFLLRLMGFRKCSNYDGSIVEWALDSNKEMAALPNYDRLVDTGWVQQLTDNATPATYTNDSYVIVEASWGQEDEDWTEGDYAGGHIPGSYHVNTDEFEGQILPDPTIDNPLWFLWPPQYLEPAIEAMGITKDTTVVVYSCMDLTAAARLWWVLTYAGVADVRLYNGTFAKWIADGGAIETTRTERPAAVTFGATVPVHPEYRAETAYVEAHYQDAGVVMADDRSWPEYIGEVTGYDYYDKKGRIPGAAWAHWGPDTYAGDDYFDSQDTTLRSWAEVKSMWAAEGITADKEVIFYCGSGWRSSVAFFMAHMMGWPNIRNYSDGWMGWSSAEPLNPIETGRP